MLRHLLLSTIIFVLFAIAIVALLAGLHYRQLTTTPLPIAEEGTTLIVPAGSSIRQLASNLKARGLQKNDWSLPLYARYTQQAHKIKAGEYAIPKGITAAQLLNKIVDGDVVAHQITLVEGWNFREMRAALAKHSILKQTLNTLSDAELMAAIGYPNEHPEGRFFPDTYQFTHGMSDASILKRAYQRLAAQLAQSWQNRAANLPYKNAYEALIMASIIEKETGAPEERPEIAGVFIRRLAKGMKLQTDPTVIYGMGAAYNGNIRRADLRQPTPYNTYGSHGIPPTPIAMVGKAAIEAALHPKAGTALYFVARGDGTGRHQFSNTLAEHNHAVQEYLKRLRAKP